jgi:type II secretory pathway component HofQ
MKHLIILALALAFAPVANAQLYKYVDKDGKTVYSDQPPLNVDSKQINVQSGKSTATQVPSGAGNKSYVERDKEQGKSREEAREKEKKSEDAVKKADADEQRCIQAKSAYQTYANGGRIHKFDDKGERVYLGDAEIEAEQVRTRREMDEACKKS